jgi:FkbM family methyltransferase
MVRKGKRNVSLVSILRRAAARVGLDVQRLRDSDAPHQQAVRLYRRSGATVLFDVGANVGQYASSVLGAAPGLRVVSFEPLPAAHRALSAAAARRKGWTVAGRMALGARAEDLEMNVARNSVSSSLLAMAELHAGAEPASRTVAVERVPVRRLDEVAREHARAEDRIYLKVDAQGYEAQVLEGASGCLARVVALQLELSLRPLYRGQPLLAEMLERVEAAGFVAFGFCGGFRDPRSAELLQMDGFFLRPPPAAELRARPLVFSRGVAAASATALRDGLSPGAAG